MSWNPYENLPPAASFSLTSSDLRQGEKLALPQVSGIFGAGGQDVSPQLSWSGAPQSARSLVLTMIDVDVKPSQWSHWVVVGLPVSASSLPQGAKTLPGNARALVSNFGDAAYAGPCPPPGTGVHHYQFTIWALPTAELSLPPDEKATELTAKLSHLALEHASLTALVQAPAGP